MRILIGLLLLWATFAIGQTFNPTVNNTPGCTAASSPPYCSQASPVVTTNSANTGAITVTTDPLPANTTVSDITALLYPGANPKVVFHFQDWWGCPGHMNIGQTGNSPSLIAAQAAYMLNYGGYGLVIDWAGNLDSGKACRLTVTNAWATYLTANFAGAAPLHMSIMIDGGGLTSSCPTGATDQTSCLSTALISENDYVRTNYAGQAWYILDGGRPLVFYFIDEASWSGTNWTTVWANVKTHTNAYANPPKFLFEDTQTHTQGDGGYAWMANPQTYDITKQLWWGSPTGLTPTDYNNFYAACLSHPANVCVGMVKKGFDDGIGFGGGFTGKNRVQSQRFGQTVLDTANLIGTAGFSAANQLDYLGIPYNDYEEGTGMEMGINNGLTPAITISGTTLSYTVTKVNATYSTLNTVDRLRVLYCSISTSCQVATGLGNITPALSGSAQLSGVVPVGTWQIKLQLVNKTMFQTTLSNALSFNSVQIEHPAGSLGSFQ